MHPGRNIEQNHVKEFVLTTSILLGCYTMFVTGRTKHPDGLHPCILCSAELALTPVARQETENVVVNIYHNLV